MAWQKIPSAARTFCAAFVFSLVAGCGSDAILQPTAADQQAVASLAEKPYRLQPGEKVRITIYGEAGLSGEYQIDPGGFLSLPLVGVVKAAGISESDLQQLLVKRYSQEYLKNPKITVSVSEFRPFYIIGEVEKPGAYPYTSGLNVLSAIAIAGGTTYRASHSRIYMQHPGESGLSEYTASAAIPVMPGDIIQIPRRYF
jgi:protein involved in polysaccharide export with SLBB domain